MPSPSPSLPQEWRQVLAPMALEDSLRQIETRVREERRSGKAIYPAVDQVYEALKLTPLPSVKVVILGQDPYHGPGQAHGLSFSVPKGERVPPSLRNIYKELKQDLGIEPPKHGHLEAWARQGVLLLNSVLTVEGGAAGSHAGLGWERITDAIIQRLSDTCDHLVFVLWGAHAQRKAALIDESRHLVIRSPHPSPLSASRGLVGSRPFSKINDYLVKVGKTPIDWRLPA